MLGLTPRLPEFHADRWRRKTFSEIRNSLATVLTAQEGRLALPLCGNAPPPLDHHGKNIELSDFPPQRVTRKRRRAGFGPLKLPLNYGPLRSKAEEASVVPHH
jgi:hypothetical protein